MSAAKPPKPADMKAYLQRRTQSAANEYGISHWMKPEVRARLPQNREDFDNNRDPSVPLQKADMRISEAERRRRTMYQAMRQSGQYQRGSKMVRRDKPQHNLRPPLSMSIGPDGAAFSQAWMNERMDALKTLKRDRRDLTTQKTKLSALYAKTQSQNAPQLTAQQLNEAERDFYIRKRQAQQVLNRSQKHIQKFKRKQSQ